MGYVSRLIIICLHNSLAHTKSIVQLLKMEQALAQGGVEAAKKEVQVLAVECIRAFEAVGMDRSEHHQVKKALALCSPYAAP